MPAAKYTHNKSATFHGDEYLFIDKMCRHRPDFDYRYVRKLDGFTILFNGDDADANSLLELIKTFKSFRCVWKSWK
jgi:hypothetical protein